MRTQFPPERLSSPKLALAEKNLRACVHCGICTASCPTYLLTGDERDSPRGRIVLIQQMLEQDAAPSAETVHHLDRCLSCLGCRTACPSGVDYPRLIDEARVHIARTYRRDPREQLLRRLILEMLTRPALFRVGAQLARQLGPLARVLPGRLGQLVGRGARPLPAAQRPAPVTGALREVALVPGCVQRALAPHIDAAAARVLARRGLRLVTLEGAGCCGALAHHLGEEDAAKRAARRLISAFDAAGGPARFAQVLITASGCAAHLADYAHLLADDPRYGDRAQALADGLGEVAQLVSPRPVKPPRALRVAVHRPCSLSHGLRHRRAGAMLLAAAGHEVLEIPETEMCCGSAGSYALLQPELSGRLRARKRAQIARTVPDVVVSSNIGCIEQLSDAAGPPVLHWIELLDWSEGGPPPPALQAILAS